jgi:hypothetical protein
LESPTASQQGEADGSRIYLNVGIALSNWGSVESDFAQLFTMFIDAKTFGTGRVFGSILGIGGKRDALEAATGAAFFQRRVSEEDKRDWKLLWAHYEQAATRKNEIAHGVAIGFRVASEDRGFLLVPIYDTKKSHAPWNKPIISEDLDQLDRYGQYRYTSDDIAYFGSRFIEMGGWAIQFAKAYHAKYAEPTPDP